jgi:hypothetical protein
MPTLDPDLQAYWRAYDRQRLRAWRKRQKEARAKLRIGLVKQALRDGTMPEELIGLQVEMPTEEEIAEARRKNYERARRRVERRKAHHQKED